MDISLKIDEVNRRKPQPFQDKVIYALLKWIEAIVEKIWMCYDKQMGIIVLLLIMRLASVQ